MIICGRTKDGKQLLLSEEEIIKNALEQESQGIEPHFAWFNYKTRQTETPPGWLVWSSLNYGCGVVYRRNDGKMIISTGVPGDFCYC